MTQDQTRTAKEEALTNQIVSLKCEIAYIRGEIESMLLEKKQLSDKNSRLQDRMFEQLQNERRAKDEVNKEARTREELSDKDARIDVEISLIKSLVVMERNEYKQLEKQLNDYQKERGKIPRSQSF